MNISENLEKSAYHFPGNIAVIDGDREITYAQFNQETCSCASALVSMGVQPGDYVALCAPNSYAWLAFYFGALKAGAVAVTFSHLLTVAELSKIISDCCPAVLFTTSDQRNDLKDFEQASFLKKVIIDQGESSFSHFLKTGCSDFPTVSRDRQDTAVILYTGGTTGIPKGAMLSHANLQSSAFNVAHYERSDENDRALCFLPLNHVFAQVHITHSMVHSGGGIILQPAFDIKKALDAIQQYRITNFYAVPTIYIRLLALEDLREKINSIRYCFSAAASMAVEVVREWKNKTGLNIHESYGMTESAAMVTYNHYHHHVVGSVGAPINLVEVQIRDLEGKELPPGTQGEICIRGPNITSGYLNKPEETAGAFWGSWFRSGDIGYFDENGHLYIVDRLKDMIITGGENVYPREIEELLYTRPEVLECAVVGLPDPEYGERVTAFIVVQKDHTLDGKALKAFLKEKLAGFKVPKEYISVAELPKSNAGKILKREIRQKYDKPDL
ncbi:MAG: AMP-binding protein [Deltaproteobacteria bacterium]|jgi:long-chain acyl-CoA synthetase|nr:AMP-binding protein [Deltaproteobacteria bacterium]